MQKLFIDFEPDGQVTLNEEQSRHIAKSLRMRKGDMLTLTSGNGNDYGCIIENTNGGLVTLSVCYKQANNSEPSVKVTLYQGVPKSSKQGRYSKMHRTRNIGNLPDAYQQKCKQA